MRRAVIYQIVCVFACLSSIASGQDFILENAADPAAASVAMIVGTDLVITDAAGKQFVYVRRPDLDSADGLYQAFFSAAANQHLRWPVAAVGRMQIGTRARGMMTWTPSRMQIRSAAGGPVGPGTFIPGSPLQISTVHLGPDRLCAAHIDAAGQLQYFIGHNDRWRHFSGDHPPGVLVPGAPLHLISDPNSPVPRVYTISGEGKFVEVIGGRVINDLPSPVSVKFVPGGHFAVVRTETQNHLYSAERHGRLWRIDLLANKHEIIEGHLGVLAPGLPIRTRQEGRELFMTDRLGAIVVYSVDSVGIWHGPESLAEGFAPAGNLAIWVSPGSVALEVTAVDRSGKLQVLRQAGDIWTKESPSGITLPSGTPLTAFETKAGLSLTAVLADGRWVEFFQADGKWEERVIAAGFPPRAPPAFSSFGPMLFAADITGRLISAYWSGTEWQSVICNPVDFPGGQVGLAPRLVSRKTIANRRIDPVIIGLQNTTAEELVIRVLDDRIPGKAEEIVLAPNSTKEYSVDRDAGGTLEEVYLVPGPNGPVQRVRRLPLPPRQFYDLAVYANRVTYQYIDRRKKRGPAPDFKESTLVSLGVFPLPPGNLLPTGTQLDVYRIATTTRNPGAAAILDPMQRPSQ